MRVYDNILLNYDNILLNYFQDEEHLEQNTHCMSGIFVENSIV